MSVRYIKVDINGSCRYPDCRSNGAGKKRVPWGVDIGSYRDIITLSTPTIYYGV